MMMWDVADSQLYFTETLYPDFSVEEFKKRLTNTVKPKEEWESEIVMSNEGPVA